MRAAYVLAKNEHGTSSRPARAGLSLLVLAILMTFLSGCKKDGPLVVKKIIVEIETAAETHAEREHIRDDLRRLLRRSDAFSLREGNVDGSIVRAHVFVASRGRPARPSGSLGAGVDPSQDGTARTPSALAQPQAHAQPALVSLTLTAFGRDKKNLRYQYRGAGVAQGVVETQDGQTKNAAVDVDALMLEALQSAVREVAMAREAEHLPAEALIARLTDPAASKTLRRQAVQSLGSRLAKPAVPALSAVLLGDDKELANTALRALSEIKDPRAVDAIITFASGKPTLIRKQAINAVRGMGTRKGEAWLFTLSTGHPDPDVQVAAQDALSAVAARSASNDETKPSPAPGG